MPLPTPRKSTATHFYKYSDARHLHWLKDILLRHELYLPNLTELNDDDDCLPRLKMQSEDEMVSFLYERFVKDNPALSPQELQKHELILRINVHQHGPEALHPDLVKSLDLQLKDFRVYSMTKRYDMTNLWAYYANGHTGYCLEFQNVGALFEHAKDVNYLDPEEMEISFTDPSLLNGDFLFCKPRDWMSENEVRLMLSRKDGRSKIPFNPHWLTRIILGKKMAAEDREQILEWAKQRDPELTVVDAYRDATYRKIRVR